MTEAVDSTEVKVVDKKEVDETSAAWLKAKRALTKAQEAESIARGAMVKAAFPNGLTEGTNSFDLGGKWKLKVTGVVSRKVDEAALPAVCERIAKKFDGFDAKELVKWTPEVKVGDYKKLPDNIKKLFDNALIIKGTGETSPQVKIEEAKR